MRKTLYLSLVVLLAGLSPHTVPVHAQTVTCSALTGPPGSVVRVTIGHFAESDEDIGGFCRLLAMQRIAGTFVSLGRADDPATAPLVQSALESGKIDVLWLNTAALGLMVSRSTVAAKVLGVTDFLVVHVVARDPRITKVTDPAFREVEVRVPPGRSGFFADALFAALGLPLRCLDLVSRCAEVNSDGASKLFLDELGSRAVVLAVPTLHLEGRNRVALVLAQISPDYRLIAIPPDTVTKMRRVPGMVSAIAIPRGYYGLGARREVPPVDIPSLAAGMLLVGSTPAEVAIRVQDFTARINRALLTDSPRLPPQVLEQSLQMVREMSEYAPGRITVHPEFARQLRVLGRLLPGLPVAEAQIDPQQLPPLFPPPPPPPPAARVQIRKFIASPVASITATRLVQLCWEMVNALSARIDPDVGALLPNELEKGCRTVAPRQTTTYRLSATGPDGRTVIATVQVTIAGN